MTWRILPPKSDAENIKLHKTFYKKSIKQYGVSDVRSLHWNSLKSQKARFVSLLRAGDYKNFSVLDLGCGRGDFFEFLVASKQKPNSFIGIDFIEEFVEYARKKYEGAKFYQKDFFSLTQKDYQSDYVICNGALNIKQEDNLLFLQKFILYFLPFAKKALGMTLLKVAEGYLNDPLIHSYSIPEVKMLIKKITPHFTIYDDYADNDFTVIIKV